MLFCLLACCYLILLVLTIVWLLLSVGFVTVPIGLVSFVACDFPGSGAFGTV